MKPNPYPDIFGPSKDVRKFNATKLIGKRVKLTVTNTDAENNLWQAKYKHDEAVKAHKADPSKADPGKFKGKLQEARSAMVHSGYDLKAQPYQLVSDWVDIPGLIKGNVLYATIKEAHLIEASNGGRADSTTYPSWDAMFSNEERKSQVESVWSGGLLVSLSRGGGDPDQADVQLTITIRGRDFTVSTRDYTLKAPDEWYSDLHASHPRWKCVDGFYSDAEKAVSIFDQKMHGDLFGERYFPVISISMDHPKRKDLLGVAQCCKSCSKPIVSEGRLFIGTRCKKYEFAGVITECYALGGQVPIGLEWNWD